MEAPLALELRRVLRLGRVLGEMRERIKGKEAGTAKRVVGWEDALHVLALVLELRRHLGDLVARDGRVGLEKVGEDGGAAAVHADDKQLFRLGVW